MKYFILALVPLQIVAFGIHHNHPPSSSRTSRLFSSATAGSADSPAALRSMTFCNLDRSQEPQLLCDFLMEIGACSTSICDADRDTEQEEPIFSEPGATPWDTATLVGDQGRDMWTKCDVAAHFAASADLALVAELVQETLDIKLMYEVNAVPDRDWVIHVQQSWNPILVEGIVLRFPWHTNEDVAKITGDEQNLAELQLEGGVAFGTGEHPTTQLCLSWVQNVLRNNKVTSLMDYGAGSGVLGLAACAFNKSVKSIGVDIDVDAVRIANANAVVNGLNMQNYLPPLEESMDSESKSVLMKAYQKEHEQILPSSLNAPVHDACVANILAGPLVTLAKTLAGLVKPGGALGLSGILTPQANMVVEAYVEYFDDVKVEKESGGWVLITGTRKVTES